MHTVAAIELEATADLDANRERVVCAVEHAADRGATLIVLPEASAAPIPGAGALARAETLDGPFVSAVREVAARRSVSVVVSMFCPRESTTLVANTAVAIDRGDIVGTYVKIHNFDAYGHRESDWASPGEAVPTVVVLDDLRVGLMTCYDLRFGELASAYGALDVDVIALGAAWVAGPTKAEQFATLVSARALDAQAFVIAAAQPLPRYSGGSRIVGPTGTVLASDSSNSGVTTCAIDIEEVSRFRAQVPLRSHRRVKLDQ